MSWWDTAPGRVATVRHTVTGDQLRAYVGLVGEPRVPDHVPEPLVAGLVSRLLGTELPGHGTNYLKQELDFHRPVPIGEPVEVRVEITRVRPDKQLVDLAAACRLGVDGPVACEGRALVRTPHIPAPAGRDRR